MIGRVRELAQRRQVLVARAAVQRAEFAGALRPAARKLAALDRLVAAVRRRPIVASVAVAALVLLGPRRLLYWALRVVPFIALLRRN
jgi:hypothetical protein